MFTPCALRSIKWRGTPSFARLGSLQTPEGSAACAALAAVYANWVPPTQILTVGLWSSELSKLAANAMLPQHISSINALSAICEATGTNIDEVARAIGPKFLKASSLHLPEVAAYWHQVVEMNEYQKCRFSKCVVDTLFNTITGKRIAVLGFAFKVDTGDTRKSAAITIIRDFQSKRALINIYDPQVTEAQISVDLGEASPAVPADVWKKQIKICGSALEACRDAKAVVIAIEWKEFKEIDWKEAHFFSWCFVFVSWSGVVQGMRSSLAQPCCSRPVYAHMKKPAFVFDGCLLVDAQQLTEIGLKVSHTTSVRQQHQRRVHSGVQQSPCFGRRLRLRSSTLSAHSTIMHRTMLWDVGSSTLRICCMCTWALPPRGGGGDGPVSADLGTIALDRGFGGNLYSTFICAVCHASVHAPPPRVNGFSDEAPSSTQAHGWKR
ncbi:UDP-glucose/GDP-mannose dehydrogenase family, UDP binding domain-containing protein [Mycena vulgaris]|nr:UDP-glucose/GDP-mannose dehydrogenase family, UDP binding domain-containing protein [Mycena vulgaris]